MMAGSADRFQGCLPWQEAADRFLSDHVIPTGTYVMPAAMQADGASASP